MVLRWIRTNSSYQQLPINASGTTSCRCSSHQLRVPHICIILTVPGGSIWLLIFLFPFTPNYGTYSPLDHYESLNDVPIVGDNYGRPYFSSERRAVATSLYSNSYAVAIAVLAYSLRRANITTRLVLTYIDGRVSEEALCTSRAAGWETHPVPFIPPPHNGKGILEWYQDQYTKLNIWGLDKLGIDRLVYLDADTLVLRNFNELFDTPFNFAAVPDVYAPDDPRGFSLSFNGGVLALRPSSSVLADMKSKLETSSYPLEQAEQAFLNTYFASKCARLPYAYNAGIVIKRRSPALWEELKRDMRVVHFTNIKPFLEESQAPEVILTRMELEAAMEAASLRKGLYADEIGWWRDAYRQMMGANGDAIASCH